MGANGIVLKVTMKAPTEFVFDACITLDEKWNFNVEMLVNEKPLIFDCKFEISEMRLTFSYDEESTAIVFKYDFVPLKIPLVNSWKNYLLNKKIDPAFGRYIATLAFRSTTLGDIMANLNHEIFGLMHFKTEIQIHDLKMINEYKVEDDIINTFTIQHPSLEQDVVFTGLMHTEDECMVHLKLSAGTFGEEFFKVAGEMIYLSALDGSDCVFRSEFSLPKTFEYLSLKVVSPAGDFVCEARLADAKLEVLMNLGAEQEFKLIFAVEESSTLVFMIAHVLETETHEDMTVKLFTDGEIVTFNAYVTPELIEFVKDLDVEDIWNTMMVTYVELFKELMARFTIAKATIIEPVLVTLQPVFVKLVLVHNEMYEKNLYFLRDIEEQFLYYTMDCITKVKEAIKELVEKTNDLMTDFTLEKMSLKFEDTFQAYFMEISTQWNVLVDLIFDAETWTTLYTKYAPFEIMEFEWTADTVSLTMKLMQLCHMC